MHTTRLNRHGFQREGEEDGRVRGLTAEMESDVIIPNSDQTGTLEPGKLYIHLFHGRKTPDEELDDWGSEGPMIGPLDYVHVTYMGDVKFAATPAVIDRFFPDVMKNWRMHGYANADGPLCDWHFKICEDLIEHGGRFYGDWSVFVAEEGQTSAVPATPEHSSRR